MKTIRLFLMFIMTLAIMSTGVQGHAQDDQPTPRFYIVSTMHWNTDYAEGSGDRWMEIEKEYLEKVTKKNEYIMGSSYYTHMLSPDSRELLQVQVFASWEDIEKAAERNGELTREAWPDQEARQAYFTEKNKYYDEFHSDEIYNVMDMAVPMEDFSQEAILYMRKSKWTFPEDGSGQEFMELYQGNLDNIIKKNEYIKGYYPSNHFYGSDRRDFIEAYFVKSLTDLDNMFNRNNELAQEAWPDADERQERGRKWNKYFAGSHSDAVYYYISELTK
jgi:hypothetical protein